LGPSGQRNLSSNSRARSSVENVVQRSMMVIRRPPVDQEGKRIEIKKVPTRKLLASVKLDIRREIKAASSPSKPLKKK
jgi:hypothetical protein